DEATELVLSSYHDFSPVLADTAQKFVEGQWIDAPARPGKRGGAFCAYTTPSVHPYVLLNYTSRRRDVLTLAHELGHGLHAYPAHRGRAVGRPLGRALGAVAGGDARRRRGAHRGVPDVVVLRAALHLDARVRLRVRLRAAAGALRVQPLSPGGRGVRAALPRNARGRWLAQPRGARRRRGCRPRR